MCCNMITNVVIFIALNNYSTMVLSIQYTVHYISMAYLLVDTKRPFTNIGLIMSFPCLNPLTPIAFSKINLLATPWKDWQSTTVDFTGVMKHIKLFHPQSFVTHSYLCLESCFLRQAFSWLGRTSNVISSKSTVSTISKTLPTPSLSVFCLVHAT